MRTTVRLPDDLLTEAKKRAVERGVSFTRLVEEALRETLARDRAREDEQETVQLTTVDGSGLQPGVDLDDTAALRELMDPDDAPA